MSYARAIFLNSVASDVESEIEGIHTSKSYPITSKTEKSVPKNVDAIGVLVFTVKNTDKTIEKLKYCLNEMYLEVEKEQELARVKAYVLDFSETKHTDHTLQLSLTDFNL